MKIKKMMAVALAVAVCLMCASVAFASNYNDSEAIDHNNDKNFSEYYNENEGMYSETEAYDIESPYTVAPDDEGTKNVNISKTITLKKGESKTYSFNVSGGLFNPDHNTVSVVITKTAGSSYRYISEDVTTGTELANVTYSGNANRTLSNLNPSHTYEITLINLGTSDLTLGVSITSYID